MSSVATDWGSTLTPDGLTIVFASSRSGVDEIYAATRTSLTSAWSTPVAQTQAGTAIQGDDPFISSDGGTLYWSGGGGLLQAPVVTPAMTWGASFVIASTDADINTIGGADVSPDGLHIMYTGGSIADGLEHQYEASRATPDVAFGTKDQLPGIMETGGESFGSWTSDRLEVVFQAEAGGNLEFFDATRTTVADGFATAVPLSSTHDVDFDDGDADISYDAKTLVFASTRPGGLGGWDLWFTARSCM